ncbi:MAG: hypothetical protein MK078_06210 [Crocinitomicaceae bacterium]|nr:hypothetical protein [Crocinitomicaceae bacterium]
MRILALFFFLIPANSFPQDSEEIGVWDVKNGELIENGNNLDKIGLSYWGIVSSVLPNSILETYVVSLRLITDGRHGDMGGINQLDETLKVWQIDLDTADMRVTSTDSIMVLDYTHTLIHEFGHLITLNASQIELTNDQYEDLSKGYLTAEGYATKESYLYLFVQQFWRGPLFEEWIEIDFIKNDKRRYKALYEFYLDHEEKFLTDYAAETPEEDIAESWTFFVLSDKPTGKLEKHAKVRFFYQFQELVNFRENIRENLGFIPLNYIENPVDPY